MVAPTLTLKMMVNCSTCPIGPWFILPPPRVTRGSGQEFLGQMVLLFWVTHPHLLSWGEVPGVLKAWRGGVASVMEGLEYGAGGGEGHPPPLGLTAILCLALGGGAGS